MTAAQPGGDDPKTRVELVARTTAAVPGGTLELGLHFEIDAGWHTYMPSQNDTGLPASAVWTLEVDGQPQQDLQPGEIHWSAGHRYVLPGDILDHVYEGSTTPTTLLTLPENLAGEWVRIVADLEWLVCDSEQCLPEFGQVSLQLPIASTAEPSSHASLFASAERARGVEMQGEAAGPVAIDLRAERATITSEAAGRLTFLPDERSVYIKDLLTSGTSDRGFLMLRFERGEVAGDTPDTGERLTGWIRFEPSHDDRTAAEPLLLRIDRPLP
ncbi:MAG: protein-disulfide reductase DsbD domain-containing protein [Planctomycetota bacterium]